MSSTLSRRRVLLTGATNGIGLAAAIELARRGALLTIIGRNPERTEAALQRIRSRAPGAEVESLLADLSLMSSVRNLAAEALARYPEIHVLINNAGAVNGSRRVTSEGNELTLAANHLGAFLLTNLLLDRLRASAPSRVITTSSDAHRGVELDFDDIQAEHHYGWLGLPRYGETKLANILFTRELARRLEGSGVTAYCFHPGLVATGFNRNNGTLMAFGMTLMRPFSRSPAKGAETLVWLAEAEGIEAQSGGYFQDLREALPTREAQDPEAARRLWDVSSKLVGL